MIESWAGTCSRKYKHSPSQEIFRRTLIKRLGGIWDGVKSQLCCVVVSRLVFLTIVSGNNCTRQDQKSFHICKYKP